MTKLRTCDRPFSRIVAKSRLQVTVRVASKSGLRNVVDSRGRYLAENVEAVAALVSDFGIRNGKLGEMVKRFLNVFTTLDITDLKVISKSQQSRNEEIIAEARREELLDRVIYDCFLAFVSAHSMWTKRIFNVAKTAVFVAGASVISDAKIYNQIAEIKVNLTADKMTRLCKHAWQRFLAKKAATPGGTELGRTCRLTC